MPEPLVCEWLRRNSLDQLCSSYAIEARRHGKHPNLVQLKYNQIDSPMSEAVVRECRGLILDEARDWAVVAYPYTKFFNYGEGHAAPVDWANAMAYAKEDGSLMLLYYYEGWQVASSGLPDASGPVLGPFGKDQTFADLFWDTWKTLGYQLPEGKDLVNCYMFELCTPFNRVIVPYSSTRLILHGVRLWSEFQEKAPEPYARLHGWECIRSFPLISFSNILNAAAKLNPVEQEGYVVVDTQFNRVKVKSPQYVALAHMKDGFGPRRMLELVRVNEGTEFLNYFPQFRRAYTEVNRRFTEVVNEVIATFETIKGIADQKAFALEANKTKCPAALFALRSGKAKSAAEFFARVSITTLERIISLDGVTELMSPEPELCPT